MSAIDLFRSRVAQSAKAAAGAARQISSLDDMARNDDYVQSEGLRVSDRKKRECTSSATSASENSELPSVVNDLSEKFVEAFSGAARKHSRPRPTRETNNAISVADNLGRPSKPVEVAGKRKSKSKDNILQSNSVQRHPKSAVQTPHLMSSVAEFYEQNNKMKIKPNQSASKGESKKQLLAHVKTQQDSLDSERGEHYSKSNESPRSLAAIPSYSGQGTNVLLVNEHHAHILHELDYDSDTDSSDGEPAMKCQNDIEMGRLGNVALHDQLEQELEESIIRQNSLNGPTYDKKEKDVHRFMKITADLESEREVLLGSVETPKSSLLNVNTRANPNGLESWDKLRGTAGEETNKALQAGFSWVRNVASPQLEAISKQIMTKVSEADLRTVTSEQQPKGRPMIGPRHQPPTRNDFEEENFTVSTSSSFLADEDMAELERIRMKNSTSTLKALVQMCVGNPRLAFIVVTLFFAVFAYFYSRHKSVDDVL